MTRAVLWVVPAVAVVAALLAGGSGLAVIGAGVVGVVAGLGLWSLEVRRVRRFARRVNSWAGDDSNVVLAPTGGSQWRELGTAVNALGTQLREAREELRSLVPWAQRLVASLDEPAFVFGADGRLAAANDPGLLMANLPSIGDAPTVMSALGSVAVEEAVREARESGHLVAVTEERAGRDLRITASPLDEDVLVVVSDRTRERRVEELRRDFVINASHELKTPVTAIQTLTEALLVAPSERRDGLVSRLGEEAERLSRLVYDLLDLRLLEEDGDGELTSVDLVSVVRASVADSTPHAEERGITFDLALPEHAVVAGHQRDLALVVDNLVANAVQYNQDGGTVTVGLRRTDGAQELTVADTGVGIPRNAVDRIFERFYRVDVARSRARGGTGLGLSIVRNAVERHGGRISVESLLGAGTTFTVRLPVGPPE